MQLGQNVGTPGHAIRENRNSLPMDCPVSLTPWYAKREAMPRHLDGEGFRVEENRGWMKAVDGSRRTRCQGE